MALEWKVCTSVFCFDPEGGVLNTTNVGLISLILHTWYRGQRVFKDVSYIQEWNKVTIIVE